jgi:enoyl-[acyl-carrier protein] reductase I
MNAWSLKGRKGLIIGIANEQSIAYGCAEACHTLGADLAITYLNEKTKSYVNPLAERLSAKLVLPLNVENSEEMDSCFAIIKDQWGTLDFLIHSIAFAQKEDLHGRVIDSSREGFLRAMDVSCHSFLRLAKYAEPLLVEGSTLITMSYYGAQKVIPNYGLMGIVKAALESSVRYVADELGPKGIRVHAVSPGPLKTRAASGIKDFDQLVKYAESAPLSGNLSVQSVGMATACLLLPASQGMTGSVTFVDHGLNIKG